MSEIGPLPPPSGTGAMRPAAPPLPQQHDPATRPPSGVGRETQDRADEPGPVTVLGSWVWAFLPALSFGTLAPVPIVHAAARLRSGRLWASAAGYVAATLAMALLFLLSPETAEDATDVPGTVGLVLMLTLMTGGTVHALLLRRRVFQPRHQDDPALAAALARRARRGEAIAIVERDQALAIELCIGRPDLPRQYDDGGLIDVNHVPPQVLVHELGIDPGDAAKVIAAREHIGGFTGPSELIAYALPPAAVDRVRDRLIFLRP